MGRRLNPFYLISAPILALNVLFAGPVSAAVPQCQDLFQIRQRTAQSLPAEVISEMVSLATALREASPSLANEELRRQFLNRMNELRTTYGEPFISEFTRRFANTKINESETAAEGDRVLKKAQHQALARFKEVHALPVLLNDSTFNGDQSLVAFEGKSIKIFDLSTFRFSHEIPLDVPTTQTSFVKIAQRDSDNLYVFVGQDLFDVNIPSGQSRKIHLPDLTNISGLAGNISWGKALLTRDKTELVAISQNGHLLILDVRTSTPSVILSRPIGFTNNYADILESPNGNFLFIHSSHFATDSATQVLYDRTHRVMVSTQRFPTIHATFSQDSQSAYFVNKLGQLHKFDLSKGLSSETTILAKDLSSFRQFFITDQEKTLFAIHAIYDQPHRLLKKNLVTGESQFLAMDGRDFQIKTLMVQYLPDENAIVVVEPKMANGNFRVSLLSLDSLTLATQFEDRSPIALNPSMGQVVTSPSGLTIMIKGINSEPTLFR